MECIICYENTNEFLEPYKCNHKFHKKCIKKWNKTCPLCRTDKKNNLLTIYPNVKYLNIEPYLKYEKNKYCYSNLHQMYVFQSGIPPYGAIVKCYSCNTTRCYNIEP